ncbi:MAG: pilus assembly protein TadG-related protein [Actinomycetota bacterium]
MRLRGIMQRDDGAVMVIVALVMIPLMVLTAGGVGSFTLYGSQRELQKAADQAALAGAAALPPLNPNVVFESLPFPIPNTDPIFELTGSRYFDLPRLTSLVPDPRSVACEYGAEGLSGDSASLVNAFGGEPSVALSTLCADRRITPTMQSTPIYQCLDQIAGALTTRLRILETNLLLAPLLPDVLAAVLEPVNRAVGALNQVVPAALSPTMKVDVASRVRPPMFDLIGVEGLDVTVSATATRRLKNAVMVPIVPGGSVGPVVTDGINLNQALAEPQPALIETLGIIDSQLNELTASLGLAGCQNLLHGVRQDLGDIYNPPVGPAPSAADLVKESVDAIEAASAASGVALAELAGDAYYAIGAGDPAGSIGSVVSDVVGPLLASTALALLGPITATQIPTLDVAIVIFTDAGNEDYRAAVIDAANARGLFRAVLTG